MIEIHVCQAIARGGVLAAPQSQRTPRNWTETQRDAVERLSAEPHRLHSVAIAPKSGTLDQFLNPNDKGSAVAPAYRAGCTASERKSHRSEVRARPQASESSPNAPSAGS